MGASVVGAVVGAEVGAVVGATVVGAAVGALVVGALVVGAAVGTLVVGAAVGVLVVGALVVGAAVGAVVRVGEIVGAVVLVGEAVTHTSVRDQTLSKRSYCHTGQYAPKQQPIITVPTQASFKLHTALPSMIDFCKRTTSETLRQVFGCTRARARAGRQH